MQKLDFNIPEKLNSYRLDMACVQLKPKISRRKIRRIIDVGGCYLNKKRIRVASRQVKTGDRVTLQFSDTVLKTLKSKPTGLAAGDILMANSQLIVVNKPVGLPVQQTRLQAKFHLVPVLQHYCKEAGLPHKDLRLVHRLDKETSGIVLVARNVAMQELLTAGFRSREFSKEYHCLVMGKPPSQQFVVRCELRKDHRQGMVFATQKGGKDSETQFQLLRFFPKWNISLVRCVPITGRTHQIRVHLAKRGFPILGDKLYGSAGMAMPKEISGLATHHMLHSRAITHPSPQLSELRQIQAPYPATFQKVLNLLES